MVARKKQPCRHPNKLQCTKEKRRDERRFFYLLELTARAIDTRFSASFRIIAAIAVRRMSALTARFRCQLVILGEAAFLIGNTASTLASDFALFLSIHRCKTAVRLALLLHKVLLALTRSGNGASWTIVPPLMRGLPRKALNHKGLQKTG